MASNVSLITTVPHLVDWWALTRQLLHDVLQPFPATCWQPRKNFGKIVQEWDSRQFLSQSLDLCSPIHRGHLTETKLRSTPPKEKQVAVITDHSCGGVTPSTPEPPLCSKSDRAKAFQAKSVAHLCRQAWRALARKWRGSRLAFAFAN